LKQNRAEKNVSRIVLVLWMLGNIYILYNKGFDPYPFILSCLTAFQIAIMMSQKGQEEKNLDRAEETMINLKSELEIRILHKKLHHLIKYQQKRN
jgi:uncharacterized membrane protein